MKKKILYLFIFSMVLFGFNSNSVGADGVEPVVADNTYEDYIDASGIAGGTGNRGQCINNALCQNQNFIMFETSITHMDNNGIEVYDKYYFTNNPAMANGSNIVYVPEMTTTTYDFGTAAQQLNDYFTANDYAVAKQLLAESGITSFTGSINGKDAYALQTQIVMQYQDSNGNLKLDTLKNMLQNGSVSNRTRIMEYLTKISTGIYGLDHGTLLEYINGFTLDQCSSMSALMAASELNGCGQFIIDIASLLGISLRKPTPACPGGSMNLNNPTATCDETIGGITQTYSYTASGGSQANVHRQYGLDQNATNTGEYCKLFCQEEGTAVLPGALADTVQLGSYIIWPTSSSNETNKFKTDYYPLKFTGKKECKLVLMPDHDNFPGMGCEQDPVAEYVCRYNATKVSGSKKNCNRSRENSLVYVGLTKRDYRGINFETVRVANRNYFNETDYCGTEKNVIQTLTTSHEGSFQKYEVKRTSQYYNSDSYGQANYSHYNQMIMEINSAADNAYNACQIITPAIRENASSAPKCMEYLAGMGAPIPSYCSDQLDDQRKVADCNNAKARYNSEVEDTNEIEDNMQTCRDYIDNFNTSRSLLDAIGQCGNFSIDSGNINDYYHFSSQASMSYQNGEYSVNGSLIKENTASIECTGDCGGLAFKREPEYTTLTTMDTPQILASKVSQIENRTIVLTTDLTGDVYGSNSNYSYINKKKNQYSTSKLSSNYLEINNLLGGLAKVLPTDYNADIVDRNNNAVEYTLNLVDVSFGENNRFTVTNSGDYVCKYEMAKKNDGCVCPQDSKMPGKDLMKHVAEDPISCADAQQKYCDSGDSEPYDKLYCPDMKTPLTACLNTGIGYDRCVALVCPGTYKCKNTNGLRTGMDITDCVQTKLAQGVSLNEALNYCDSVVCPIGKTIIYRTIKLENPFPGKDISKIVYGFNNDVKGRYPGTNWNGVLTVYNKIRNNRETDTKSESVALNTQNTSGTTIYQTKEPLYTFVLNGVTINKIRDYNDKQQEGYNDFTLECKTNNSAGCISYTFVHNENLSGLIGGTCRNISSNNSFYTCDD